MRRVALALSVLGLCAALGFALPPGTPATPGSVAVTAAKKKCKHRHHHRKRCRRKSGDTTNGGGSGTGGDGGSGGSGGGSTTPGRLLATEREISATQLQLQLSRPSLPAGTAIIEQYNAGSDPHNLVAETQSAVAFSFGDLAPGGDQKQTVTLHPGTYTLYCSLLDHRSLGMQATLTVN
jgi:Copper binding proteins, plastocyanin/azurin family